MALQLYKMADIDPMTRPFQIDNAEFARICHAYSKIIKKYPEFEHYDYRAPKDKQPTSVDSEADSNVNWLLFVNNVTVVLINSKNKKKLITNIYSFKTQLIETSYTVILIKH